MNTELITDLETSSHMSAILILAQSIEFLMAVSIFFLFSTRENGFFSGNSPGLLKKLGIHKGFLMQ